MDAADIAKWNTERAHNLKDILCVYGKVKQRPYAVKLQGVDAQAMELNFKNHESDTQMTKFVDIRDQLEGVSPDYNEVVMSLARQSARKLNKSFNKLDKVLYPCGVADLLVILAVLLPPLCYLYRPLLHWLFPPQAPVLGQLGQLVDSDYRLLAVIVLEFAIHAGEVYLGLWPLLHYYRITESPDLLIEYTLFGLLEGYGPIRRLKSLQWD